MSAGTESNMVQNHSCCITINFHYCTCMGVVGEGSQGFWSGARGGGEKVSTMLVLIGTVG